MHFLFGGSFPRKTIIPDARIKYGRYKNFEFLNLSPLRRKLKLDPKWQQRRRCGRCKKCRSSQNLHIHLEEKETFCFGGGDRKRGVG